MVPPDPIPNSEVKRNRADGSVGSPHVRVGHRQTPNKQKSPSIQLGLFCLSRFQRARLNMQPKAAGAVCAPQLAAKLLRATAIYQAVLDEQMSFAPM